MQRHEGSRPQGGVPVAAASLQRLRHRNPAVDWLLLLGQPAGEDLEDPRGGERVQAGRAAEIPAAESRYGSGAGRDVRAAVGRQCAELGVVPGECAGVRRPVRTGPAGPGTDAGQDLAAPARDHHRPPGAKEEAVGRGGGRRRAGGGQPVDVGLRPAGEHGQHRAVRRGRERGRAGGLEENGLQVELRRGSPEERHAEERPRKPVRLDRGPGTLAGSLQGDRGVSPPRLRCRAGRGRSHAAEPHPHPGDHLGVPGQPRRLVQGIVGRCQEADAGTRLQDRPLGSGLCLHPRGGALPQRRKHRPLGRAVCR